MRKGHNESDVHALLQSLFQRMYKEGDTEGAAEEGREEDQATTLPFSVKEGLARAVSFPDVGEVLRLLLQSLPVTMKKSVANDLKSTIEALRAGNAQPLIRAIREIQGRLDAMEGYHYAAKDRASELLALLFPLDAVEDCRFPIASFRSPQLIGPRKSVVPLANLMMQAVDALLAHRQRELAKEHGWEFCERRQAFIPPEELREIFEPISLVQQDENEALTAAEARDLAGVFSSIAEELER